MRRQMPDGSYKWIGRGTAVLRGEPLGPRQGWRVPPRATERLSRRMVLGFRSA